MDTQKFGKPHLGILDCCFQGLGRRSQLVLCVNLPQYEVAHPILPTLMDPMWMSIQASQGQNPSS